MSDQPKLDSSVSGSAQPTYDFQDCVSELRAKFSKLPREEERLYGEGIRLILDGLERLHAESLALLEADNTKLKEELKTEKGMHQLSGEAHYEVRAICEEVGASAAFVDDAVRQVVERLKAAEATLALIRENVNENAKSSGPISTLEPR